MSTYSPKASEIDRDWHLVDAEGLVLGRMATEVARILRGKHKPTFAPHLDTGDHVVIINASKVVLTGDKLTKKVLYRHSGYPGGIKSRTYGEALERDPSETVRRSVLGMLPKSRLGNAMGSKLKVYDGPTHPHGAQNPTPLDLEHARARTARA
ncbi:MAG: 50S ribosomal protein L13 [Actinomycetota bacterium]